MRNSESLPFDFRWAVGVPVALGVLLLFGNTERLDFYLARQAYEPGVGFIGRHSWFLENVLHDGAKQVVIGFAVISLLCWGLSFALQRLRPHRRWLGYLALALTVSGSVVSPLKTLTGIHCPWSLTEFGGTETYAPLLAPRVPTEHPGRCWPGGHASAGFSLFALFFALRDRRPRLARVGLGVALLLGVTFSIGRMLQGAHFMSHNLWTAIISWAICLALYRAILYRPSAIAVPEARPEPVASAS